MLRDKNLVPLSHQHQHALALCVFIERGLQAAEADPQRWNAEIEQAFRNEIRFHFEAEEKVLFPAAAAFAQLAPLVQELLREHVTLLRFADRAARRELAPDQLLDFARTLSEHVRKEERQLFESLQQLVPAAELARLGAAMDAYFMNSGMPGHACDLPDGASPQS